MRRIRTQSADGYVKRLQNECRKDPPYSRFLIRQGMDFLRESLDLYGFKPDTFSTIQATGADLCDELGTSIRNGQKERALSIAFYLKEILDYTAHAVTAARRAPDEHQPTNS